MSAPAKTRLSADERRQAVLDTACRTFSKRSYRGATTAEIAREAGITEPILYRHFGSKRELYVACLEEAWSQFRAIADAACLAKPEAGFGAVADAYMAKRAKIRLVDLWVQALTEASEDPVIAKALRAQIREVHEYFADTIRASQERGSMHADRDAVAEAWLFIAGGLLGTMDVRLGGLLGDDLTRVRTERRRWLLVDPD